MGEWLLYGANGFTGRRIAAEAVERGERPILAGRSAAAVKPVAEAAGLDWRVFPLDDPAALDSGLQGVDAVLLAAGPFSATSAPVVDACLRAGIHYLDITGEIPVFEAIFARDAEAAAAGVTLLPGVGFDVVPTDCLAAALARALPGADRLELAFVSGGGPSAGTARTMVEGLARGGAIRQDGRLKRVPHGWRSTIVPFADRPRRMVSIPWGDVATSWRTTGIPNVIVYGPAPAWIGAAARVVGPALRNGPVRRWVQRQIGRRVRGPEAEGSSRIWGRVSAPDGRWVEGTGETPGGYRLTALSSVECVTRLRAAAAAEGTTAGNGAAGARTPAGLFGPALLESLPGCSLSVGPVQEPGGPATGTGTTGDAGTDDQGGTA